MAFVDLLLQSCDLKVVSCGQMRLGAPWMLRKEASPHAGFLFVMDGSCIVHVDGETAARSLAPNEFLFFTRFISHNIGDSLLAQPVLFSHPSVPKLDAVGAEVRYGGAGDQTRICLGRLIFTRKNDSLTDLLPALIHCSNQDGMDRQWLRASIDSIVSRDSIERLGGRAMLNIFATMLLVEAVRTASEAKIHSKLSSLPLELASPEISRVLEALHQSPGKGWNLELMAAEAHMSRSAFAARFRELVGTTPFDYLTRWRIGNAERLLTSGLSVKQVSQAVGYRSPTAFARSFRRIMRVGPTKFRSLATT